MIPSPIMFFSEQSRPQVAMNTVAFLSTLPLQSETLSPRHRKCCSHHSRRSHNQAPLLSLTAPSSPVPDISKPQRAASGTPNTAIAAALVSEPEHPTLVPVPVETTNDALLSAIAGLRVLRMGPGIFDGLYHSDGKEFRVHHWFDGLASVHDFSFSPDGLTLSYRSRSLADHVVRTVQNTPSWRWGKLSFSGCNSKSLFQNISAAVLNGVWPPIDPNTGKPPHENISIVLQDVADKGLSARTDAATCAALCDRSLELTEFYTFGDIDPKLSGEISASHAGVDKNTGDMYDFVFSFGSTDRAGTVEYSVFEIKCGSTYTRVLTKFRAKPTYMHTVVLTKHFVILTMWPLFINAADMLLQQSFIAGMDFDTNAATTFYIIDRETGRTRTVRHGAAYAYHIANAFESEEGDEIILDVCRFENGIAIAEALSLDSLRGATGGQDFPHCQLVRYKLPVCDDEERGVDMTVLCDRLIEMPIVAPEYNNVRNYRYVYGATHEKCVFDAVLKVDVLTGKKLVWREGNMAVGEPLFVRNKNAGSGKEEDDGFLLVACVQKENEEENAKWISKMVMLCAKTMTKIGSATLPYMVPLGFHGSTMDGMKSKTL